MALRDRVGVELGADEMAAVDRICVRRGLKRAGLLRSFVIERLYAEGELPRPSTEKADQKVSE